MAFNQVVGLALGIILARLLGAHGYGVYAYAFAIMNLLLVAADAGVPVLLMREIAISQEREEWGLLRGVLIRSGQFVLLASIIITIIGILVLWFMADRMTQDQIYTTLFMLLMLPLATIGKAVIYSMRGLQRVVISQMVELVLRPMLVLLIVAGVFFAFPALRQPQIAMAAQLGAVLTMLIVGIWALRRFLPQAVSTSTAEYRGRQWLKSTLAFVLIGGAGIIYSQADIIMLGWFGSSADVGIYRVAVQGAALVSFGLQAATAVGTSQIARLHAQGDMVRLQRLVTYSTRIIFLTAVAIALVFMLESRAILGFVFGSEFTAGQFPMIILIIAQLVIAFMGLVGPLLTMTGYERLLSKAYWFSAMLNVVLNLILIPLFGAVGAALATALSLCVWSIFLAFVAIKRLRINVMPFGVSRDEK